MKDNKGFTLVELLAVVAILSLLVIIALPNIMAMFKEAKKNSFLTECKQIYKTSQQQWMNDSMFETEEQTYTRCDTCTGKSLKLNGRQEIDYFITLNKAGKVTSFKATDGTYQYIYDGDDLKVEDIAFAHEISTLREEDVLTITSPFSGEIYIAYDGNMKIGQPIPEGVTYYNSYPELLEASSRPIFIKHVIKNNIVRESYVGFRYNGNVYYMRGGDSSISQESRKTQLKNIYNNTGCHDETDYSTGSIYGYRCINRDTSSKKIDVGVYNDSRVIGWHVSGCYVGCRIYSNGSSNCDPLNIAC